MKKLLLFITAGLLLTHSSVNAQYIYTVAGDGTQGYTGNLGQATAAELNNPKNVVVDTYGNIYITDCANNVIREVNASTGIITTIVGNRTAGYSGDGGYATACEIQPQGIAVDKSGNIFIADYQNDVVREVIASTGIITTIAGDYPNVGYSGDGAAATSAELNGPDGVAVDASGNIFICDGNNGRIREVTGGIISTVPGALGLSGSDAVAVDKSDNIYVAETGNNEIIEVSGGNIITKAGNGTGGYRGDGGLATTAELNGPFGVAVDKSGNIYIADYNNSLIRMVNTSGIINTVAGISGNNGGYNSGNGGLATAAGLMGPTGVAVDTSSGNFYIAMGDYNNVIRKVTNPNLTITIASHSNVLCNGSSTGSATANAATGGSSPYTYSWSPSGGTNLTASNLSAASYTVTVTDANSISATASVTISQPASPLGITIASNTISSATANAATGGTSPYSYDWAPSGGTNLTASSLSAGTYTITATDANSCTATATVTIALTQPSPQTFLTTGTWVAPCGVTSVEVQAWGGGGGGGDGYGVQYGGGAGGGGGGGFAQTNNIAVTPGNTYTVTVGIGGAGSLTDRVAGISGTSSSFYGDNSHVLAQYGAGGQGATTFGAFNSQGGAGGASNVGSITYNGGTGGLSNSDYGGGGGGGAGSAGSGTAGDVSNVNTGYGGAGGSGGGGSGGQGWSGSQSKPGNTFGGGGGGSDVFNGGGNGAKGQVILTWNLPALPTVNIGSKTDVACYNESIGSAIASPSGGASPYTYSWAPSGGTNSTASNLSAGTYTVTLIDNCGNTATASTTITQPASALTDGAPAINQNALCFGENNGSATAAIPSGGTAPYTYQWNNGSTSTSATNTVLSHGTYTVNITDAHGCTATSSSTITITQPAAALGITIATNNDIACFGGTVSETANAATGGTSPYTYKWSDVSSQTSLTANGLSAGSYTITATDVHSCSAIVSITITQPVASLAITIASQTNPLCNGGTGSATANTAAGGTLPYTYSWTPSGGTNLTASNLSAGSYTITATDNHGCTAQASVTITQPTLSITMLTHTDVSCVCNTGSITANAATGGFSPYTYNWTPGGGTNLTANNLSAGNYIITVTDHHGCAATTSAAITQPAEIINTVTSANPTSGCNGVIAIATGGGTSPYTYLWATGAQTTDTIKGQCAGTYCCAVTDNNGCSSNICITLTLAVLNDIETINSTPSSINIYPDPNNGYFTVTDVTHGQVIELYNYLGQMMNSIIADNTTMHFDISNKANGVYLIRILNKDGSIVTQQKIVKAQ